MQIDDKGAILLAAAIIRTAQTDLLLCRKYGDNNKRNEAEIQDFFDSDYFYRLTGRMADYIRCRIYSDAGRGKRCRIGRPMD